MRSRRRSNRRLVLAKPHRLVSILILLFIISFSISAFLRTEANQEEPASVTSANALETVIPEPEVEEFDPDKLTRQDQVPAGTVIDEYREVPVYSNGTVYTQDHGLNFSESGYYFGYKWQCVEYVKRFYYLEFGHEMPDGAGHAKYFFDTSLKQGEYNAQRGLYQYHNGGSVKPELNDLVVFNDSAYGHVAIVSGVGEDWVELIQQNSEYPRERFILEQVDGNYFMRGEREPAGWLRLK